MRSLNSAVCAMLCLGVALGGCASADGRYPSLAVRDAERVQGTTPTVASEPPIEQSSDPKPIYAALKQARAAYGAALAEQSSVRSLIITSQGMGVESDQHARALVAMARLISLRAQTARALADLDEIEGRDAIGLEAAPDLTGGAQFHIEVLIDQQDQAIDSLSEMLAQ